MTIVIMMMAMMGKIHRGRETKKREKEEKIETQKKNVKVKVRLSVFVFFSHFLSVYRKFSFYSKLRISFSVLF